MGNETYFELAIKNISKCFKLKNKKGNLIEIILGGLKAEDGNSGCRT